MEQRTKMISFNKLEVGMIIAKNLEQNGRILLKKDISITEEMIKTVKKLYLIENVEIYDKKIEKKQVSIEVKKQEDSIKIEEEFKEISLKLTKNF